MTDEEKRIFEKWFEEKKEKCEVYGNGDDFWVDDEIKKFCLMGYEQGLKVGRPQWHDLRKDPNDLPKEGTKVISEKGDFVFLQDKRWKEFSPNWDNIPLRKWEEPIAWCEIPTFDKE